MSLSVLETRLKRALDEQHHDTIEREFSRFEVETTAMGQRDDKIGQARLTEHEISRLPMGNQYTDWNVVRWQVVKAAALHYGVTDWTSKVDTSLTYEENVDLMRQQGTAAAPSMKEVSVRALR